MVPSFVTNPDPNIYLSNNYVVLDYETTNTDKGNPRLRENSIVYSSWKCGPDHPDYTGRATGVYDDEYSQQLLVRAIQSADFVVAQNSKFEIGWTKRIGVPLESTLWYCTILGQYTIDGNRRTQRDLDSLCKRYGIKTKESLVSKLIKGGVCPSEIPKSWLIGYGDNDVDITEELFLKQREELSRRGLLGVAYTKNLFTPVLVDIELNGMFLDRDRVLELYEQTRRELGDVEQSLSQKYGEINFNSPIQIATLVYEQLVFRERTDRQGKPIRNKPSKAFPKGQPITDADTLTSLTAETQEQREFVSLYERQSKLNKRLTTYLERFKEAVINNEGYLYGRFNQTITQTHRLSSSGPNFQNFDRGLKYLFTSRWKDANVGERDEAQLEFRVATYLGDDAQGRRDIADGADVHSYTAGVLTNAGQPTDRQEAKGHTFKPLYGGISGTLAERTYYDAFRRKYKGINKTQDYWVDKVLNDGTFTNLTGLTFYYKLNVTKSGYVEGNTNVRNYPVQYLATGEIVPIGCVFTWHYMKAENMRSIIVNTVHDSIITEEFPEESDRLTYLSEQAFGPDVIRYMEQVYGFTFDVPLNLETKINTHWGAN